jgi:Outer membrane protein beta-barrel domain
MMKKLLLAALFALGALTLAAHARAGGKAADLGPRGGLLAQVDADFGGDKVATVFFEDDSDQDITAGQGLALSVGGYFRPVANSRFELEGSVGYKYATTKATNADVHLSRTLLQLEGLYRWPNGFYVGAGLMHHLGPTIHGDGFFDDVEFDDASGLNVEIGWRWISVHYVDMSYSTDDGLFDDDVDASHVGLRFTWRFGQPWTNR